MVQERDDVVGLDAAILMSPAGLAGVGPLDELHRPDGGLQEVPAPLPRRPCRGRPAAPTAAAKLTEPRQFNLMFKTFVGPVEDDAAVAYLRPETAQGIFVNFLNVQQSMRRKLPFGIAQIGKSFRNEITPGNFIFRTREFEQMEMEFFVQARHGRASGTSTGCETRFNWYLQVRHQRRAPAPARAREGRAGPLLRRRTTDIEYHFPLGWGELEGIAHRGRLRPAPAHRGERQRPHLLRRGDRRAHHCPT